ncbi:MAG: glutamine amidotransferase, partial [Ancalomicrobiaceae bacterium]|nr:glutamine amidotransferase [Ancalomicrobiaceae bacterium]
RLRLLKDYVAAGGGLLMFGGYCSFQGFRGTARYHNTPIEDVLPVECIPYDDRVETPEGFRPVIVDAAQHPILAGISGEWPLLLGFNEVVAKPGALVLATATSDYRNLPLLVLGHHGAGRTLAWTTDIGPHWLPPEFSNWAGYRRLWTQALTWVIGDRAS